MSLRNPNGTLFCENKKKISCTSSSSNQEEMVWMLWVAATVCCRRNNCEREKMKESDNEWCDMPYQVLILIFIKYNNYLWNNWSNGRQPHMILDDEIIWWAQTQCSHSLSDRLPVKLKRKWFLIIRCNLLLLPPMWLIYECSIFLLSWE